MEPWGAERTAIEMATGFAAICNRLAAKEEDAVSPEDLMPFWRRDEDDETGEEANMDAVAEAIMKAFGTK